MLTPVESMRCARDTAFLCVKTVWERYKQLLESENWTKDHSKQRRRVWKSVIFLELFNYVNFCLCSTLAYEGSRSLEW